MTTDDLTVYGKPIGSLWDRRIGGRYELTEIRDTGGTGMWVTLQRVGSVHAWALAMSVYDLGRNYVPVAEKDEPAEAERRSDARRLDSLQAIVNAVAEPAEDEQARKEWIEQHPHDQGGAVFAEDVLPRALPEPAGGGGIQKALAAAWDRGYADAHDYVRRSELGGDVGVTVHEPGNPWKPAPSPPLPWVEHPRAWWQSSKDGWLTWSSQMGTTRDPAVWQRVAVIPWDLIDRLRDVVKYETHTEFIAQAILDAADGAS